jgi:hypothetical protein
MGRLSSTPPIDDGGNDPGGGEGGEGGGSPATTAAAIARYEDYLHALGDDDIDTLCGIAGPAIEAAQDEGIGPCPDAFGIMLGMIPPEQSAALRTATVDPARVDDSTPGDVIVPVDAVEADVAFAKEDLGSSTLRHQDGDWFIVE